jgi:methyl-accepting chemotaxis protein
MDLDKAIAKHAEWKVKLRSAMNQKQQLDAAQIARDNCCDLGVWLHGNGRRTHAALDSFKTCVSSHANFHAQAGKVAMAINGGKYADADKMMGADSPYAQASSEVAMALRRLKKETA